MSEFFFSPSLLKAQQSQWVAHRWNISLAPLSHSPFFPFDCKFAFFGSFSHPSWSNQRWPACGPWPITHIPRAHMHTTPAEQISLSWPYLSLAQDIVRGAERPRELPECCSDPLKVRTVMFPATDGENAALKSIKPSWEWQKPERSRRVPIPKAAG